MYQEHVKYDFPCWSLRKQEGRTESKKNRRKTKSRTYYEYKSELERRTVSDYSSSVTARKEQINMVRDQESFKSIIEESEWVHPMVTIKNEILEDMEHIKMIKQEEEDMTRIATHNHKISNKKIIDKELLNHPELRNQEQFAHKIQPHGKVDIWQQNNKNPSCRGNASEHIENRDEFDLDKLTGIDNQFKEDISQREKLNVTNFTLDQELDNNFSKGFDHIDIFDQKFMMCKNQDCPKIGAHICSYPALRETGGVLKTKGVLNVRKSKTTKKPRLVSFNHSFKKSHGISFYFKRLHSHIEIHCKSRNQKNKARYRMILYDQYNEAFTMGSAGTRSCIPINMFPANITKYKILLEKQSLSAICIPEL